MQAQDREFFTEASKHLDASLAELKHEAELLEEEIGEERVEHMREYVISEINPLSDDEFSRLLSHREIHLFVIWIRIRRIQNLRRDAGRHLMVDLSKNQD